MDQDELPTVGCRTGADPHQDYYPAFCSDPFLVSR